MIYVLVLQLQDYKATSYNNVGLTISSFGIVGNNLSRQIDLPSFEYPLGSRTEHLTIAGIWIGGIDANGDTLVSTSAVDQYAGGAVAGEGFEFYKLDSVSVRSSLLTSPYYYPDAFSEEDFLTRFSDFASSVPNHNPLYLEVKLHAFLWSYSYIDDIVFLKFTIYNRSSSDIRQVYIGWYSELVTGNRDFWGDQFASGSFFQHKRLHFVDSLNLVWEKNSGYDTLATSMAGFQILGYIKDGIKYKAESLNFVWKPWNPNDNYTDADRYRMLSADTVYPNVDDQYVNSFGYPDPTSIISFGPIDYLAPGESLVVFISAVGGLDEEHLFQNAQWALRAFDYDFVLPAPPPSPKLVAIPGNNKVELYFDDSPESFVDPSSNLRDFEGYKILRGLSEVMDSTWIVLKQYDLTAEDTVGDVDHSIGYNTGLPPKTTDCPKELNVSECYHFVDYNVKNGFKYYYSVVSFDVGNEAMGVPVLESSYRQNLVEVIPGSPPNLDKPIRIYPNPFIVSSKFNNMVYISNLPEEAEIYIYSLDGNLIRKLYHKDPYRGEIAWDLKNSHGFNVAPGLYIVVVKDLKTGKVRRARLGIIR